TYDRAGGGLIAGGLAYAALLALLPGMLLVLSIFAIVVSDEATRERIVSLIADAVRAGRLRRRANRDRRVHRPAVGRQPVLRRAGLLVHARVPHDPGAERD